MRILFYLALPPTPRVKVVSSLLPESMISDPIIWGAVGGCEAPKAVWSSKASKYNYLTIAKKQKNQNKKLTGCFGTFGIFSV